MNTPFRLLLFSVLIFSLSACENFFESTVTIDPPASDPAIAVHAFNYEDSLRILVSRTVGPLDELSDTYLNDANVMLSKDGTPLSVMPHEMDIISDTFFYLDTFVVWRYVQSVYNFEVVESQFEAEAEYDLEVRAEGFPTARSKQVFPASVPVDSVVFTGNAGVDEFGDPISAIDVYFIDPAGVDNYYAIEVFAGIPEIQLSPLYASSIDPATFQVDNRVCFQDGALDGQSRRIRVTFIRYDFSGNITLGWSSITRENFLYLQRLERYFTSNDNPFVTPAQLYSNIENGVGIFGLSNFELIPVN